MAPSVMALAAASESINQLAVAQQGVVNDLYWKPLVMLQMEGRLHRGGQVGDSVHFQYVLAANTIDDLLVETLARKAETILDAGIVDDGQALVKSLGSANGPVDELDAFVTAIRNEAEKGQLDFDVELS